MNVAPLGTIPLSGRPAAAAAGPSSWTGPTRLFATAAVSAPVDPRRTTAAAVSAPVDPRRTTAADA